MKYRLLILVAAIAAPTIKPNTAFAVENAPAATTATTTTSTEPTTTTTTTTTSEDPLTQEETNASVTQDRPEWKTSVQQKYALTDEQMKQMTDAGIKGPGLAITAGLAKASGKTVQEVALMRTEQKMGWGKIAKDLGVHPSEIGQSVSSLHKNIKEGRVDMRADNRAKREARMAAKDAKRQEKLDRREAKRAEKANKKQ
jgi:hypothetical protein